MKEKRVALRRCTGCQQMLDKRGMARVVLNQDGEVSMDFTGKMPGRGAYICKNAQCLEKSVKHKGLERSLKCAVPEGVYEKLKVDLEKQTDSKE